MPKNVSSRMSAKVITLSQIIDANSRGKLNADESTKLEPYIL